MKKMFYIPILLMMMSMIAAVMAPQNVSANNAGVVIKEKTQLKIPDKPEMKIVAIDLDPTFTYAATSTATTPDIPDEMNLLATNKNVAANMILEKRKAGTSLSRDWDLWEMIARWKKRRP
ncbi:hypothetical protein H6790_00205 [Candidatus Nomurabacteria bacterium]|nr:hypothetical protein [Candidatus Nomurabacteria bacterium]